MRDRNYINPLTELKVYVGIIIALILFVVVANLAALPTRTTVEGEVTKRERLQDTFLVWVDLDNGNKETFRVKDNMLLGKFASSDTYGRLQENKRYKLDVIGWRVPFFSMYRNILQETPLN